MDIHAERRDTTAVLTVAGDVDADTAYDLYLAVIKEAEDGYARVAVDLAGVTFLDSTGLGMLVRSRDDLVNNFESRLLLRNPSDRVRALLDLTALTADFDLDG